MGNMGGIGGPENQDRVQYIQYIVANTRESHHIVVAAQVRLEAKLAGSLSGRDSALLHHPPLRTVLASFPAHGSSELLLKMRSLRLLTAFCKPSLGSVC